MKDAPEDVSREMDLDIAFDPVRITHGCWNCRKPQVVLVKLEGATRLKQRIGACTNPECFRYTDVAVLKTWTKE